MQAAGDLSRVRIVVEGDVSHSTRARQVSSMFDAPPKEKCRIEYDLDLSGMNAGPWNVGLVVGPSGSGKTTVMRHLWGEPRALEWSGAGVVDDIAPKAKLADVTAACQAVGFNTIPAWMRPYHVLSNGEKFRVDLARRLLEGGDPVVVDEFTSVVDRQVAQIGSHAVQKFVRKGGTRFVAVGCHYDVIDWLQPDWVLDMATRQLTRRLLQRRPSLECTIGRLPRAAWSMFAPFHYLTGQINQNAQCFGIWVGGQLACFAAMIWTPVSTGRAKGTAIRRIHRVVTLPDFQGLGLAMRLLSVLGGETVALGQRLRIGTAAPTFSRVLNRSAEWKVVRDGVTNGNANSKHSTMGKMGGTAAVMFEFVGPPSDVRLLAS